MTVLLLTGCGREAEPAETPRAKAPAPRLDGEIHVSDQRKRVGPFIMHEPGLDLRVQCLSRRDDLAKDGKDVPLCFNETKRAVDTALTTIRVEHHEGMRIGAALHLLRPDDEAVHFVVDAGGSPYQLLDLAFSARRAGAYQASELRILSGHAEGHRALLEALKTLYPKLAVEVIAVTPPRPAAKPPVAAPAAP